MSPLVLASHEGPVAVLTLNRSDRHNSFVPAMLEALLEGIDAARANPDIRALLLLANGRSFSTGGDLQGFADHLGDLQGYASALVGLLNRVILALVDLPFPVVAGVQGPVTGGAFGLVLASDVVLLTPEASFTPYYTVVGFSPDGGWTALLPGIIGAKRAAEVIYCNRTIQAPEAVDWGLASRIVPRDALHEEAVRVCQEIAAGHPGSQQHTRLLLQPAALSSRLENERENFIAQIGMTDTQIRMLEFLAGM